LRPEAVHREYLYNHVLRMGATAVVISDTACIRRL